MSDGHGSHPMEAGASKMHPGIGPFQFLMANGRREGGRVYRAVFSSCGRAPFAWAAGPGGAGPPYGEVWGSRERYPRELPSGEGAGV